MIRSVSFEYLDLFFRLPLVTSPFVLGVAMFLSDLQGYVSNDVRTTADVELNIISSSTCGIIIHS